MTPQVNQKDSQGRRHGVWKNYYEDGTLKLKRHYLHGAPHGVWEDYRPNGNLWWRGTFSCGRNLGLFINYRINGSLRDKTYIINIK
jgi:antitoxin component YwqK of YwqJK toxin-antitoxin module